MCRRWGASCTASVCRDRRRGRAIRKRTRPRRRPSKRAPALLRKTQRTHRNKRVRLFFQDEARIGQKGRTVHVWWRRGERPPGLCDKRFTFAYIFAAVEPGTDNGFALVMPHANTEAMQEFLDRFAATIGEHDHVVMMLDRAGWHGSGHLRVPDNITLEPLPAYSPELNPVERVWLYLKQRFLSHRLHPDYEAIVEAACDAWNRLRNEVGRINSLCSYPWIPTVKA
jgi:putative transposase